MIKILLIHPDPQVHEQMRGLLPPTCSPISHYRSAEAGELVRVHRPAAVMVGLDLADRPASELVAQLSAFPDAPQVIGIGHGAQAREIVNVMRLGAADCLIRPFGPREVRSALGRVVEPMAGVAAEERNGHEGLAEEDGPPEGNGRHRDAAERLLGGGSEAIRELRSFVRRVASSEKPVLLLGESGSGKEMAARAVHELSSRVQAPFAAANCSAIPESLFETEMFGAERGAYTDAVAKPGHLEAAADGTVFLDEIGEMSAFNQAKLLRVIEERRVRRVGGVREIPLMFRVVAASNRNLPDEVAAERFRADLFYRLGVLTYRLPSLEERVEDIPELAVRFLRESGFENLEITDNAFDRLCEHTWPGNVRELRNVVDRAAVLRRGTRIRAEDITFF